MHGEKEAEGLRNLFRAMQSQWPGASLTLASWVWDAAVLWDGPSGPLGEGSVVV